MATAPSAPTSRKSTPDPYAAVPSGPSVVSWAVMRQFVDTLELIPELRWPRNIRMFAAMLNDAQIEGLRTGAVAPIRRMRGVLDPNGARDQVVREIQECWRLPLKGQHDAPQPRGRGRFSFDALLFHMLLAPFYGHYYHEIYGPIENGKWRMQDITPIPPSTITEIEAPGGDLEMIWQAAPGYWGGLGWAPGKGIPIPKTALIPFVWDMEAGNWVGRSMLRAIYREWLGKDMAMRVALTTHEKAGVPLPVGEFVKDAEATQQTITKLDAILAELRAGIRTRAVAPPGATIRQRGIEGVLPDTVELIRYFDQSMSGRFLQMYKDLGQTPNGSRALGEVHFEAAGDAQHSMVAWIERQINEGNRGVGGPIEMQVDLNYGPDEPAPRFEFEGDAPTAAETASSILDEADNPATGTTLEGDVRAELEHVAGPWRERERHARAGSTRASRASRFHRHAPRETRAAASLPARELRRQPYDHEIAAQVDYAALDVLWESQLDQLIGQWTSIVRATQISELHDLITAAAGDLEQLAGLAASPGGRDLLADRMRTLAAEAAAGHVAEASAQGVTLPVTDLEAALTGIDSRAGAVADLLARAIGEAASRKAVQLTGAQTAPGDVADQVETYLGGLSDAYLRDQLGGALSAAVNTGRVAAMTNEIPKRVYASELLDPNTCAPCTRVDGTEYASLADAEVDYPAGGYTDCAGGPRCRGTLVTVYQGEV